MSFAQDFINETAQILDGLSVETVEDLVRHLAELRDKNGRLFILGVGGSAASASHAVNDFRKLCNFEAYCPSDNVSELTARTNDDGWDSVFSEWLIGSRLRPEDGLLILSVGGGDLERNVSPNLVRAIDTAKARGSKILGIVGRDGGYTAKQADACLIIPTVNPAHVTPHTEAFQGVVWHLLVSHPQLKAASAKWENLSK